MIRGSRHNFRHSNNGNHYQQTPLERVRNAESFLSKVPFYKRSLKDRFFNAQKENNNNEMKKIKKEILKVSKKCRFVFIILSILNIVNFMGVPLRMSIFNVDSFSFSLLILPSLISFFLFIPLSSLTLMFVGICSGHDELFLTANQKSQLEVSVNSTLTEDQKYQLYQQLSKAYTKCIFCETINDQSERTCKSCGANL